MSPLTEEEIKNGKDAHEHERLPPINIDAELPYGLTINANGRIYDASLWITYPKFTKTPTQTMVDEIEAVIDSTDIECKKLHCSLNAERYFARATLNKPAYHVLMIIEKGDLKIACVNILKKTQDQNGIITKHIETDYRGVFKEDLIRKGAKDFFDKLIKRHFPELHGPHIKVSANPDDNQHLILNINPASDFKSTAELISSDVYLPRWKKLQKSYALDFISLSFFTQEGEHVLGRIELSEKNDKGFISSLLFEANNEYKLNMIFHDTFIFELPIDNQSIMPLYLRLKYNESKLSKIVNSLYNVAKPLLKIYGIYKNS